MVIIERKPEEQNLAQAPTLGMGSGTFGQQAQQRKNIAQGGSGRFTNLQQYVQANEANPNAQILQREAQARQGELGTRQQEFVKQAEPIKSGFEAVRSGQQFVQSALQDPTKVAADPTQLQRFAGYRTQGIGDIETPFQQLQSARGTLGTQQEQLASGLETIQRDPNALQNYLQSQRVNPALATRGENVLDRFLTQSTQSGQQAIAGLGTAASAIRGTQAPSIIGDIETLRTQAQGKPLSSADVRNLLTEKITPEEEFVRSINPEYVSNKLGLNVERAQVIKQQADKYLQNINEIENQISAGKQALEDLNNQKGIYFDEDTSNTANELRQKIKEREAAINRDIAYKDSQITGLGRYTETYKPILDKLNQYNQNIGSTRQQLLQQYDPTRLSRIQALQQLAGTTQFNPLLSGGIQ